MYYLVSKLLFDVSERLLARVRNEDAISTQLQIATRVTYFLRTLLVIGMMGAMIMDYLTPLCTREHYERKLGHCKPPKNISTVDPAVFRDCK